MPRGSNWIPACGGTETPFRAYNGHILLYMWDTVSGAHAYYDETTDLFLSDQEAAQAMDKEW